MFYSEFSSYLLFILFEFLKVNKYLRRVPLIQILTGSLGKPCKNSKAYENDNIFEFFMWILMCTGTLLFRV